MSQKDYRTSLEYIQNFYQKHQISGSDGNSRSPAEAEREQAAAECRAFSTPDGTVVEFSDTAG